MKKNIKLSCFSVFVICSAFSSYALSQGSNENNLTWREFSISSIGFESDKNNLFRQIFENNINRNAEIISTVLNIRSTPRVSDNPDNRIGEQLSRGDIVTIFEESGNWVRIGQDRWIFGRPSHLRRLP